MRPVIPQAPTSRLMVDIVCHNGFDLNQGGSISDVGRTVCCSYGESVMGCKNIDTGSEMSSDGCGCVTV